MYVLIMKDRLFNRDRRTRRLGMVAVAALTFILAISSQAQAQDSFHGGIFVGLGRGQTARITVVNPLIESARGDRNTVRSDNQGGAQRSMVTTLTVTFDHSIDHIVRSEEVEIPAGGFYSFDINRDDLLELGEPGTGRLQLWIEVVIVSRSARQDGLEMPGLRVFLPTYELIDNQTGKTSAHGGVWKTTNF